VYLKLNGIEMNCQGDERWLDLLERLPDGGAGALGVCVQGRTHSLNDRVEEYAFARTLTCADEEGRRIYERSLQFLFLTAMNRLYPEARVRVEHSFGQGLFISSEDMAFTDETAAAVEAEMRALAEEDLPLKRLSVSTEDAERYFAESGQADRLRTLGYREFPHFTLYDIA